MHIDIVWREDNSGTISTTVAVTKTAMNMMGATEADMQTQIREGFVGDDASYTVKNYSDNEYTGIIATMEIEDLTRDNSGAAGELVFRSEGEGNNRTYSISGSFDPSEGMGDPGDLASMGVSMTDIDMKMTISMPGRITSHNATEQKGNTLTWDLAGGSVVRIEASSAASGGGFLTILMWILLPLAIIVLIVVVVLIVMKKKKAAPTGYGYATQPPPATGYGYTPQSPQVPQSGYGYTTTPAQPQAPTTDYSYAAPPQQQPLQPPQVPPAAYQQPQTFSAPDAATASAMTGNPIQCSQCGTMLPAGTKFCNVCGNRIG